MAILALTNIVAVHSRSTWSFRWAPIGTEIAHRAPPTLGSKSGAGHCGSRRTVPPTITVSGRHWQSSGLTVFTARDGWPWIYLYYNFKFSIIFFNIRIHCRVLMHVWNLIHLPVYISLMIRIVHAHCFSNRIKNVLPFAFQVFHKV